MKMSWTSLSFCTAIVFCVLSFSDYLGVTPLPPVHPVLTAIMEAAVLEMWLAPLDTADLSRSETYTGQL